MKTLQSCNKTKFHLKMTKMHIYFTHHIAYYKKNIFYKETAQTLNHIYVASSPISTQLLSPSLLLLLISTVTEGMCGTCLVTFREGISGVQRTSSHFPAVYFRAHLIAWLWGRREKFTKGLSSWSRPQECMGGVGCMQEGDRQCHSE